MKLIFTVCDFGAMMHTGADLERYSYEVEVDDSKIPEKVKSVLGENTGYHGTVSISIKQESK